MNISKDQKEELIQAGWTPPPKKIPVDLSLLIGSEIDFEFWGAIQGYIPNTNISFLTGINVDEPVLTYVDTCHAAWTYCEPRMDYWFCYRNFKAPTALIGNLWGAGFVVEWDGHRNGDYRNFKITGLQEGRCRPWEKMK